MYTKLYEITKKFDLLNQSLEAAKQYFYRWNKENPTELSEYVIPEDSSTELAVEISDFEFKVALVRYEIRLFQENIEAISVIVDVNAYEKLPIHYYCFFDMCGKMIDEFVD